MEKLISSIPQEKLYGIDKNNEKIIRGICLRFSTKRKKWVCGYGSKLRSGDEHVEANHPIEALADFVEFLSKK